MKWVVTRVDGTIGGSRVHEVDAEYVKPVDGAYVSYNMLDSEPLALFPVREFYVKKSHRS